MKAVNLATHFSKKSFIILYYARWQHKYNKKQWKLEFLVGLVHTKNHTYKFFSKSLNLSNLLTTEKTTPRWQGIT